MCLIIYLNVYILISLNNTEKLLKSLNRLIPFIKQKNAIL